MKITCAECNESLPATMVLQELSFNKPFKYYPYETIN